MGFWDSLFNRVRLEDGPQVRFGRYSDAYKDEEQYDAWDLALEAFQQESYTSCIRHFFHYLRDADQKNANLWQDGNGFKYEFYQGSKVILGEVDEKKLTGVALIAQSDGPVSLGLMRRLLAKNYALKYTRYALNQSDQICLRFDTFLIDGSPYKLYYALKEMALQADKLDDLIINEFENLSPINTGHIRDLPETEKAAKYHYFQDQLTKLSLDLGQEHHNHPLRGIESYRILGLCYKLDYLLSTEGEVMETFERMHRNYFTHDHKSTPQKIHEMQNELKRIQSLSQADFYKELYVTTCTFGIATPINQSQIKDHILSEIDKMDWYLQYSDPEIALTIPHFIVGNLLFHYALPEPIRELFHLYYQICEPDYFRSLGFEVVYQDDHGQLNRRAIRRRLHQIVEKYKTKYPGLFVQEDQLSFKTLPIFAKQFLNWISTLIIN